MNLPIIAGNWKMHLAPPGTRGFFEVFLKGLDASRSGSDPEARHADVVLFPPSVSLWAASLQLEVHGQSGHRRAPIGLGVQHVHSAQSGAFTGETSPEMAVEAGATYGLVGHSERRTLFGERDVDTLDRVEACWRAGLTPMLCVGETLAERQAGALETVLRRQLFAVLGGRDGIQRDDGGKGLPGPLVVAYEPVWAIGTGVTATVQDASEAHRVIRGELSKTLGAEGVDIPILYGGSVRPENAEELLLASEVGGLLVGGASLDPLTFLKIVQSGDTVARLRDTGGGVQGTAGP
jgi:triosephosphate isomerase